MATKSFNIHGHYDGLVRLISLDPKTVQLDTQLSRTSLKVKEDHIVTTFDHINGTNVEVRYNEYDCNPIVMRGDEDNFTEIKNIIQSYCDVDLHSKSQPAYQPRDSAQDNDLMLAGSVQ